MRRAYILALLLIIGANKESAVAQSESVGLPSYVDNSTSVHFPAVINQQGGSCAQAAGVGYMFTYEMNRYLNRESSQSENCFSYLYTWNFVNDGVDQGGFVTLGLNILKNYGAMSTTDYGSYVSTYSFEWATGYDKYLRAMGYRVDEITTMESDSYDNIEKIKSYLYSKGDGIEGGGVVTTSLYSSGWRVDNNYSGPSNTGYKSVLTALASDGAHAVSIVGYDDDIESETYDGTPFKGAFIVINSWGTYSHSNGRFYLPYYFFAERPFEPSENTLSSSVTAISVTTSEPKVVMKVNMRYSSRNDISIQYGVSDSYTTPTPLNKSTLPIIYNQGGEHSLLGQYASKDDSIEFAIDYTDATGDSSPAKYHFNARRASRGSSLGEGYVESLTLYDYRQDPVQPKVYRLGDLDQEPLSLGDNYFTIYPRAISASPYQYIDQKVNTYIIRGGDRRYSKIELDPSKYKDGSITLRYKYNIEKDEE